MSGPRLHSVTGPAGSPLARWLDDDVHLPGSFLTLVRPHLSIVAAVSGTGATAPDLPEGPATAEAIAARAADAGAEPAWGPPAELSSARQLLAVARAHGAASVGVVRTDPSLIAGMRIGGWFDAGWRARLVRRVLLRGGYHVLPLAFRTGPALLWRSAVDAAFWTGVRAEATAIEWRRWTASSFVALCYHRLAGEGKPGQEHLDLAPGRFAAQLRLLRMLRFRPLSIDQVVEFLENPATTLPRRCYALTCDDGFADALRPLRRAAAHRPVLFVPTACAGDRAWFAGDEPLATPSELAELARAGVAVGSHARTHRVLPDLSDDELDDELRGSRLDLSAALPSPVDALAYPHGRHDGRVRQAVRAAGWRAAMTTDPGRNGAGTDRWCLHRVCVHAADGRLAFLWKAVTGEIIPPAWHRLRTRRGGSPAGPVPSPPAARAAGGPARATPAPGGP